MMMMMMTKAKGYLPGYFCLVLFPENQNHLRVTYRKRAIGPQREEANKKKKWE